MSDDLVSRATIKAQMLRMGEPVAFGSDADTIDELAQALSEARAEIVSLRTELGETQLVLEQTEKNAERKLDELRANIATLRARVREVVGPFAEIRQALELISANKPGDELLDERAIFQTWGLKDTPTSKQITLGHLRAARQLMEEVK